jgi:hypothetical protein
VDPDRAPDPELDFYLNKSHLKNCQFDSFNHEDVLKVRFGRGCSCDITLKGQSHEMMIQMSPWSSSLGLN